MAVKQARHEKREFQQTELGLVPSDWKIDTLQSVVISHNSGVFKKKEKYGSGHNIVGVSDFSTSNRIDGQEFNHVSLTKSELDKFSLKSGDLLYCESSLVKEGIARTLHVTENGEGTAFAWHTRRYSVDKSKLEPTFLSYYLQSKLARTYLVANSIQTALTGINTKAYFSCPVCFPSI